MAKKGWRGSGEQARLGQHSDARKPQLLETHMPRWPWTEPSFLYFNLACSSLQRRKDGPLAFKITCAHVLAIFFFFYGRVLFFCVMPHLICDSSYSEGGYIMSNQVIPVLLWLSALLHGQYSYVHHHLPPPTPSVNRSHICSCWGLPTTTWVPWEHVDPYIPVLDGCLCQLLFRHQILFFFPRARQLFPLTEGWSSFYSIPVFQRQFNAAGFKALLPQGRDITHFG